MFTKHETPKCRIQRYLEFHDTYQKERQAFESGGGEIVKTFRKELGLSLRVFARFLCISPGHLSKVENGTEILTPEVARRMLRYGGAQDG